MTAKRFMYELHRSCFRDNGVEMTTGEVVHTLNELHEENQALKSDRERYEEECRLDVFKELSEENERLKQQIQTILKLTKKIEDCTYDIKVISDLE